MHFHSSNNSMKYEADRVSDDPEYLAIVSALFMARTFHVPDCISDTADTFNLRVYNTLWRQDTVIL